MREISLNKQLYAALYLLYSDTAEYIQVNHLGDIHHNRSMQLARDAIHRANNKIPKPSKRISKPSKAKLGKRSKQKQTKLKGKTKYV